MRVRVLHLYLNYTICLRSSVNDNTCLLGDAILRIPRVSPTLIGHAGYARVRAYRAWDTYDGVLSATSKRQPSFHSSIFSSVVASCNPHHRVVGPFRGCFYIEKNKTSRTLQCLNPHSGTSAPPSISAARSHHHPT